MKSIIKTLLLGMFLFVAVGVKAQETSTGYEYAEITAIIPFNGGFDVVVVYSEKETETLGHIKPTAYLALNEAILKAVGKKTKEGWSVGNVTTAAVNNSSFPVYHLRRKKQ